MCIGSVQTLFANRLIVLTTNSDILAILAKQNTQFHLTNSESFSDPLIILKS